MGAKDKKVVVKEVSHEEANENHMQMFRRLSTITNMHGTPGQRRTKGG